MPPFPKHIFLNLDDIAELPNRTLVDIMAIVVHLDTVHHTMWGIFRKIVIMDARKQECLESTDHTAIHFKLFHHNTHYFERKYFITLPTSTLCTCFHYIVN
ncbi:hypothetical protein ZEAMMB73_Zm00001d052552 [Zea mays]|uniref:Uncharacterized protein n=1 Tax=Zea mays TaxID=4577 RepID=A0A1D6QHR6_MAIZE|nr:hypothetical protein ZEAMMB73_Zm00001d052552 [Zea mays]AQK57415.1 hypothetical protein ZEAMMB73_Zm00001d052552 [Zea mays]